MAKVELKGRIGNGIFVFVLLLTQEAAGPDLKHQYYFHYKFDNQELR